MKRFWILLLSLGFLSLGMAKEEMTQKKMENFIHKLSPKAKGNGGYVEFEYNGALLMMISDVKHDRMRIVSPIIKYKDITRKQLDAMMESNFHTALDARYGVSNGVLYAAYVHPMSELTLEQLKSAVTQVVNLSMSFGTAYSSGVLSYGGK